jgi:hypothetical protein
MISLRRRAESEPVGIRKCLPDEIVPTALAYSEYDRCDPSRTPAAAGGMDSAGWQIFRAGEERQMSVARRDLPPMRFVEGDDRQRSAREFMREIAQIRALAAADKLEREILQAGIVADHHDVRLGIGRGVKLGEQRRDGGVIEAIVVDGFGLGRPFGGGERQRLPCARRSGAEDEVGDQAALRNERPHARRSFPPARGEGPVEVFQRRIGPGGFGMAEEREHRGLRMSLR